jgi:glutamyl-tRNA reductase
MDLLAVGANFRTSPLRLRERLSFPAARVPEVLRRLQADLPDSELLLLSTCNRTEVYAAGPAAAAGGEPLIAALLRHAGEADPEMSRLFYVKHGLQAIEHLMTVATSLDSLVVGETEILGQVKQAFQAATDAGTVGRALSALLQQVFRVAKRVRSETEICRGRVSVGSVAVDLAGKVFGDLSAKTVLVVGTGKIGEQTLRSLTERGVRETCVLNRSIEHSRAVADRYGGIAIEFDRLEDFLPKADIVISATNAPHYVIRADVVRAGARVRHDRPWLLIDLAVPRDIDPAAGDVPNVYLYNVDDLQGITSQNLARRQDALELAQDIIREEAAEVLANFRAESLGLAIFMRHLDEAMAEIEQTELTRAFAKGKVAPLGLECQQCRDEIRVMLHRALAKMAAGPKGALNEAARNGNWDIYSRVAARMYGVETQPTNDSKRTIGQAPVAPSNELKATE